MDVLSSYKQLSSSTPRTDVTRVLKAIVDAPPSALGPPDRDRLVETLLVDIQETLHPLGTSPGRLTRKDARSALLALKTLGRAHQASRIIAKRENLKTLLAAADSFRSVDSDAADDALRCVANALLLIEDGRSVWVEIGGAIHVLGLLEKTTSTTCIFLASRILFLSTASSTSDFLMTLYEWNTSSDEGAGRDVVTIISRRLDFLLEARLKSVPMSKEALIDILKFAFNLLCHWPRIVPDAEDVTTEVDSGSSGDRKRSGLGEDRPVLGDRWTRKLDSILPSLRRVFIGLPTSTPSPLAPPMTHVLHALLPIPIDSRLLPAWFPESSRSLPAVSNEEQLSDDALPGGLPRVEPHRASGKGKEREGGNRSPIDRALSMLTPRLSLSSRSPSPAPRQSLAPAKELEQCSASFEVLRRCIDLLDESLAYYLPGNIDPDDESVRRICSEEDVQLDHILAPLFLLLTRLCKFSVGCRRATRLHLIPVDLDRSSPLEGRSDTLGRCIRLMACVHHSQLKDASGELLFVICDSDAQVLCSQIGYGNAAGFLFSKGVMAPPPAPITSSASSSLDPSIDPITGMVQREAQPTIEMTDEEKEREAEKLFVLFERLEKSGGIENPLKKALQEGRLEKYRDRKDESDND